MTATTPKRLSPGGPVRPMRTSIKAGALFIADARSVFLRVSGQRYDYLCKRLKQKKLPAPQFTKDELRADMLAVMGGTYDGAFICRYCRRAFTIEEIAVDHANPLSRGGSLGLEGLDYPCRADNDRKGSMTVTEYEALLAYLDTIHPLARQDVLSRLEKAVKLAAGARRAQALAARATEQTQRQGTGKAVDVEKPF